MRRPPAPARVLRGLVVAAVGLGVASAGHAYAGGTASASPLIVLVALLVSCASVLVSRSVWTAGRLVAALLGMQVAVHAALWFDSGTRSADERLSGLVTSAGGHAHVSTASASTAGMVAAHAAAVVVSALLLAATDAALTMIRALASRLRHEPLAPLAPVARPRVAAAGQVAVMRVRELGAVGRRGPPWSLAPA